VPVTRSWEANSGAVRAGVDVASVAAVKASITRFGDRYLRRVFTDRELSDCARDDGPSAESLAARFAAKEAVVKVLRPGGRQLDWRSIEVRREPDGSCSLALAGEAARRAQHAGLDDLAVALSHEGDIAVALVVALGGSARGIEEPEGA